MYKTILVLAPHTDDGEFGCGGTISRFLREGNRVICAAFSSCVDSVPNGRPADTLKKEFHAAMDCYDIPKEDRILFDYQVRHFPEHRQEILDDLIKLERAYHPDMVFMPSIHDIHQDHHTIAEEAMRAFKRTTLFGYEAPWNNFTFNNQAYIELTEEDMAKKIAAISAYASQKDRAYANEGFVRGLAVTHGVQIGKKYAEVFEAVRWIL